jgi:hypothetical protein
MLTYLTTINNNWGQAAAQRILNYCKRQATAVGCEADQLCPISNAHATACETTAACEDNQQRMKDVAPEILTPSQFLEFSPS